MNTPRSRAAFALTGATCALLNIALLVIGDWIGLHYATSVTASFGICVALGFILHCRYTYSTAPDLTGLLRYSAAMALNYPLSLLFLWLFHDIAGIPVFGAAIASTGALTVYNFAASRWAIVLKRRHKTPISGSP